MTWRRELDVTGGGVRFKAGDQKEIYTLKGLLECGGQFLVGFEKTNQPIHFTGPDMAERIGVLGGAIELKPRQPKLTRGMPQPDTFLELFQRLILPPPRKRHGYEFLAYLRVEGCELGAIEFDDTSPGCDVELAHLLGPSILRVNRLGQHSYDSSERLKGEFEARWSVWR